MIVPELFDPASGAPLDLDQVTRRALPGVEEADAAALDLRLPECSEDPWPAEPAQLLRFLEELDQGTPYKAALEEFLRRLPGERADSFMLLLKESRGAFGPLLRMGGGRALLVGNAISGTASALVSTAGVELVQLDRSLLRIAFSAYRNAEHVGPRSVGIAGGDAVRLPFGDRAFDLVVIEEGLPGPGSPWAFPFAELVRVCGGELVLTVDNRFGYKRSSGRRGRFLRATPIDLLKGLFRPAPGERTLRSYRELLATDFPDQRSFALYPHTRDFTHVVGLTEAGPRLTIGPRERRNVVKLAGKAMGLFPVLTPSFFVSGTRGARREQPARIERVLDALAERLGEARPHLDVWVATRSNTALLHTLPAGAERHLSTYDLPLDLPPNGRWTIHVPLSPRKRHLVLKHQSFLRRVRADFEGVPVPEPLFAGELEGMWLAAERRQVGHTAPHATGRRAPTARMFVDAAEHMARLQIERVAFTTEHFDELVAPRFELVAANSGREKTARNVRCMGDELRERLVGRELPLCLYHGDLRGKHVQVDDEGHPLAYLDWGASEECFLPLIDLLHLVAHQRKQEEDATPQRSWEIVRERSELREHEFRALARYQELTSLDEEVRIAIEAAYPVLVAGMAELNWDYSRPLWVHRSFGV